MFNKRVIPCLLLSDGGLVKTVKFKNPKYVGDPINAVRIFNEKEVDELVFLDIDASKQNRGPNYEIIKDLASECFMPFSYGGGITSLDQIKTILNIGVEKVILNNIALRDLDFIKKASSHFGSSTIIVAIDIKNDFWGKLKVYTHTKKKTLNLDPIEFAIEAEKYGAGEIFINDVDREGTFLGFRNEFFKKICSMLNIPIIGCGGASGVHDISNLINETNISAVAAGSIFVYQGPHKAVLISYPKIGNFRTNQIQN